ncbi:MAG: hypothetical protein GX139_13165, partial [Armatimonadetes bacterium]|nr:hypothetical protein [Armatimonadota bacterium]
AQMEALRSAILKGYQELEKNTYSLDITTEKAAINIGEYDGYRNSWPVALRFSLMGVPFSLDFYIPYEMVTGSTIPNLRPQTDEEQRTYEEYLDQVDLFDAYFSSSRNTLYGTLTYRVFVGERPSTYRITVQSYTLRRTDTGKTILSEKEEFPRFLKEGTYRSQPAFSIEGGYASVLDGAMARAEKKRKIKLDVASFLRDQYLNGEYAISVTIGMLFTDPLVHETPLYVPFGASFSSRTKKVPAVRCGIAVNAGLSTTGLADGYLGGLFELSIMMERVFPLVMKPDTYWRPSTINTIAFIRCHGGGGVYPHLDFIKKLHLDLMGGLRVGIRGRVMLEVSAGIRALGEFAGRPTARIGLWYGF